MMINLIPMAGEGKRFRDAGYKVAKPLIPVAGTPMIIRAARCLPPPDRWIFVCRQEHIGAHDIGSTLRREFGAVEIIAVSHPTEGQACTCLLARDHLPLDATLNIGACDNAMTYAAPSIASLLSDRRMDALVWTFRHNPAVLQNPRMYGWVKLTPEGLVQYVSCKVPISDTPMEDHAVIGAFTFRRAAHFAECADALIAANRRTNNEFYVDEVINLAVERGLRVGVLEVSRYICWGTPQDLDTFNYWRGYFVEAGL